MDHTVFALEPYLKQLNYSGGVQPTEDGLEALHRAQAYTIPFENFDILLGRGITLEPAMIYDKLGGTLRANGKCITKSERKCDSSVVWVNAAFLPAPSWRQRQLLPFPQERSPQHRDTSLKNRFVAVPAQGR